MQMQSHRFYKKIPHRRPEDPIFRGYSQHSSRRAADGLVGPRVVLKRRHRTYDFVCDGGRLTLVAIAGSALVFLPYRLLQSCSLRLGENYSQQLDMFMGAIDENIKGYKVIRGFDLRKTMRTRVEEKGELVVNAGAWGEKKLCKRQFDSSHTFKSLY
jgi:ABC-type multidrug transport system fused ATPase/permease subunit